MSEFNFHVPENLPIQATTSMAHLIGTLQLGWPMECRIEGSRMTIDRREPTRDSASLSIAWDIPGRGRTVLSTATLLPRARPYVLPRELARGEIGRLRIQIGDWRDGGLAVPDEISRLLAEAMREFRRSIMATDDSEACQAGQRAIEKAVELEHALTAVYIEQAMAIRQRFTERLPAMFGVAVPDVAPGRIEEPARQGTDDAVDDLLADLTGENLDDLLADLSGQPGDDFDETVLPPIAPPDEDLLLRAFNAGNITCAWRDIEPVEHGFDFTELDRKVHWCKEHGLRTLLGPILRLDRRELPDWVTPWLDSAEAVRAFAEEYVEAVVKRYKGKIDIFCAGGGFNSPSTLPMSLQERFILAARVVEAVGRADPDTPIVFSIDQPLGEYSGEPHAMIWAGQLAEALLRADRGVRGFVLELDVGYHGDGGTLPRGPTVFSRLLDNWGMLEVPIFLSLGAPSETFHDPLASRDAVVVCPHATPVSQAARVEEYVLVMLVKAFVQGIFWNTPRDDQPHGFPHAGLIDIAGREKPLLDILTAIREKYLT